MRGPEREPSGAAASRAAVSRRAVVGVGRVMLWNGGSLWIGREGGVARPHAHHAIQVTLALSGQVLLSAADDGAWREYAGAIVMPDRPHRFDGQGCDVAMIFVEPETAHGQALKARYAAHDISALPPDAVAAITRALGDAWAAGADDTTLMAEARRALDMLAGAQPPGGQVDPRIERAIAWMRARLAEPLSLAQVAAQAHLSPSRFRHLFVAQTGVSFRAYLLWARVEWAVAAAMAGRSWTEAAQEAGFADSAHFSRTCRRMFGIAPATLQRE